MSETVRKHASKPYIKIGMHLLETSCKITPSEAFLPILPKIAFKERYQDLLALSRGNEYPDAVTILLQLTL